MAAADAESSHGTQPYVKQRKEETDGDAPAAGAEDILPGKLNQAVQLRVRRCELCWQELPPGYQVPAGELWTTGIFGCAEDPESCLQRKYHLKDSPRNPWLVHGTLHCCAICQEHRERKGRLDAKSAAPATTVNPPPVQEMSMAEIRSPNPAPENEEAKTAHDNAEVVTPL